jgi:F-type H+-transporting ATPase subunit b
LIVLFDWFTVAAQIINFLILVALLKRFLYGPILKVMNQREQKIASQLEQARQEKQEAERQAQVYGQKIEEFDQSRQQMFETAQAEVEDWRQEQLSEARAEVEEAQHRWYQAIQQEQDALLSQLRHRTAEQVLAIARHALAGLANVELEKQIATSFIERIQHLDDAALAALKETTQKSGQEIIVSSAFELPAEVRQRIKAVIDEHIGNIRPLNFEISPEAICGIELRAPDYKVAWSLDSYLETLDEIVSEIFQEQVSEVEWT